MNPLALLGYWREGLIVLLAIGCLWFRGAALECRAARAEDRELAQKAKADAIADAQAKSDRIIGEQAQALAATAARAQPVVERIIHAPVTSGCGPTVRDATGSVRAILAPGGGEAPAKRGAASGVH